MLNFTIWNNKEFKDETVVKLSQSYTDIVATSEYLYLPTHVSLFALIKKATFYSLSMDCVSIIHLPTNKYNVLPLCLELVLVSDIKLLNYFLSRCKSSLRYIAASASQEKLVLLYTFLDGGSHAISFDICSSISLEVL